MFIAVMILVAFPVLGDHPEHPEHPSEHPNKKTTPVTIEALGKSNAEFVANDAKLKGGKFLVFDGSAS